MKSITITLALLMLIVIPYAQNKFLFILTANRLNQKEKLSYIERYLSTLNRNTSIERIMYFIHDFFPTVLVFKNGVIKGHLFFNTRHFMLTLNSSVQKAIP